MGFYNRFQEFIISWRFATLMLSVLFFFTLLLIGVIVLPADIGPLASFAEDFKVWCFQYDPVTGQMQWSYVVMFLLQPVLITLVILAVWWKQLQQVIQLNWQRLLPYAGGGLGIVLVSAWLFALLFPSSTSNNQAEMPFPAEKLRTSFHALDFTLLDHRQQEVSLSDFWGKVILISAVYAGCGHTCPIILEQAKRVFQNLDEMEKQQLAVMIVSLDPENDSPEILQTLAKNHGLDLPFIHFLTGKPSVVNHVLDNYNISRKKEPKTGEISHANLFILIDREGRVAYRFTLGKQQEQWLTTAIKMLIRETNPHQQAGF